MDGTLDASFSGDGKRVTNFTPGDDFAWDVTLETDGKIVAAGFAAAASGGKFALARFNADGLLDDTFGGDGRVTTTLSTRHDAATAVAIQSDAKIVAAGGANDDAFFGLARYNADGTLDNTFNGDGTAVADLTPRADFAWDMVLQPDEKIVAVGRAGVGSASFATTPAGRWTARSAATDGLRQTSPRTETSPPGSHSRQTERSWRSGRRITSGSRWPVTTLTVRPTWLLAVTAR